jgi:sugar phosphate isomerase/epimerase
MTMKPAVTTYTLRDTCQTPADLAESMRKVKSIGYDHVQISAIGPIPNEEVREITDGEGLSICATHISLDDLKNDIQAVIEKHNTYGCRNVAIGSVPAEYHGDEGYARLAVEGCNFGKTLSRAGMTFSYHNHSFELAKTDGRVWLDILYEESDPRYLFAEIDTYWIQHGGGDPPTWIRKLAGRQVVVHFKDMGVYEGQPTYFEIGEGNLNWPSIVAACKEAGVQYCIVEQDTCNRDPFESIKISFENIQEMLV